MIPYTRKKIGTLVMAAATVMLTGCINDMTEYTEDGTAAAETLNGPVTLKIQMLVPNASTATRATGHTPEDGNEEENIINAEDLCVYILDEYDFIMQRHDAASLSGSLAPSSDNVYNLEVKVSPEKMQKIKVMVMANWKNGFGGNYSSINVGSTTLNDLYADGTNHNFTMPNTTTAAWMPSESAGIPMYGISSDFIDLSAIERTSTEVWIEDIEINMLRAIAKVEIKADLPEGNDTKIQSVTLSRSNKYGRFVPNANLTEGSKNNSDWNINEKQVQIPSLPDIYLPQGPASEDDAAFMQNLPFEEIEDGTVFRAYIPEMYLTSSKTGLERPAFTITTGDGATYTASFDNYDENGSPQTSSTSKLEGVLRNHIYRYTITEIGGSIDMGLEVLPWDFTADDTEWNYDKIDLTAPLEWNAKDVSSDDDTATDPGNGYSVNKTTRYLYMKPGVSDYVEGTFTLSAPIGATWHATLVTLRTANYEQEPFEFVKPLNGNTDESDSGDGNDGGDSGSNVISYGSSVSGTIDGNPITLYIRNTQEKVYDMSNEAKLIIEVQYPDRTRKEVIVVPESSSSIAGSNNYTIYQEITEIM